MKELDQLVENFFQPKQDTLGLDQLVEMVEEVVGESKATSERQESAFIDLINSTAKDVGDSGYDFFTLEVGDTTIEGVTGASKKEGTNDYGKEPYIDVVLHTTSGDLGLSMKGGTSPAVMGAGAVGVNALYPNLLKNLAPKIIQAYVEEGYAEGKAWTANKKSMERLASKVLKLTLKKPRKPAPDNPREEDRYEKQRAFYGAKVVLRTIDSKGAVEEYPLYPDAPRNKQWGPKGLPSQWSASREFATIDKSGGPIIYITSKIPGIDASTAEIEGAKVKDIYFKIADKDCIRNLFVGNAALGGPIDYLYVGESMNIDGALAMPQDSANSPPVLKVTSDKLLDVDEFAEKYTDDLYFRIRKRGFDSAFTVATTEKGGIGGYKIFTTGRYSGEGARIVITFKPKNTAAVLIGDEIESC
jgi:hypothetical protein